MLLCGAPGTNLVVVEGGPRGVKKFAKLMLRRIKWAGDELDQAMGRGEAAAAAAGGGEEGDEAPREVHVYNPDATCELVWTGSVLKKAFPKFTFLECASVQQARKALDAKGVATYWDMALSGATADAGMLLQSWCAC